MGRHCTILHLYIQLYLIMIIYLYFIYINGYLNCLLGKAVYIDKLSSAEDEIIGIAQENASEGQMARIKVPEYQE